MVPGRAGVGAATVAVVSAQGWLTDVRTSYDTVAASYAELLRDHLAGDPYDRAVLALFAELVRGAGGGPVADVGCGPGRLTAHLRELGVDVVGIDLSPGWSRSPATSIRGSGSRWLT